MTLHEQGHTGGGQSMHFGLEEWVAGGTPYVEYTDVDGGGLVSLVFAAVVSGSGT